MTNAIIEDFHPIVKQYGEVIDPPERDYIRYIASCDCAVCREPGAKVQRLELEGEWCVPGQELSYAYLVALCDKHYCSLATAANKNEWWANTGISPVQEAASLWAGYHDAHEYWNGQVAYQLEKHKKEMSS